MKSPKGFRGKYFSLAAILALNATLTLASNVQSVVDTQEQLQRKSENATSEEETLSSELSAPVMVVSKKIKEQKSEVYTASKSLVSATNITDNVTIITSEELSQKGISTVIEALNTATGISFTASGGKGTLSSLFLQGMSNKYTLLMVDGVRYNDPSNTNGADFSNLLIGDIEKIEVIKGAQSGVWGADAAAGVINIITKNATKGMHGSAGVEVGSYGHKSANVSLAHKVEKLDVMLSFQRMIEDGFSAQAPYGEDVDQYESDSYRNTTVNLKTGYWIDDHNRIELGYHDINALSSYDNWTPNDAAHSDFRQRSGYLAYKYFTGNHSIETTLSKSSFTKKELDATSGLQNYEGEVPSIEVKDTWKYHSNGALVLGGSYEKRELEYTNVGSSEQERDESSKALYVNNTNQVGNIVLTQALRYDSYGAFDDKLTGKLGLKYLIQNDFNFYANYGTAYRAPSMLEMIYPWGSYGVSNFNLKPENIKSANVGMHYAGLTINVFRNEIEDMIDAKLNSSYKYQYINLDGTTTFKGIEISYEQQLYRSLLAGANYTYIDAKEEDGTRLIRRPRYQTSMYATYMPNKQWAMNINGTYIGSRVDASFDPITYAQIPVETGNYLVANTKVTYHATKDLDIYLKVNNLFDHYYQSVYGYASAERSYYLGLQAKF